MNTVTSWYSSTLPFCSVRGPALQVRCATKLRNALLFVVTARVSARAVRYGLQGAIRAASSAAAADSSQSAADWLHVQSFFSALCCRFYTVLL